MVRPFTALCGLSWGALCAIAGPINQSGSDDQLGDPAPEATRSIGVASEPLQSTARDVLRALQTQRPLNVVIPPGSVGDGGGQTRLAALYPEGWAFVSQSGRLLRRDSRWIFAFDGAEDEGSLTLLCSESIWVT